MFNLKEIISSIADVGQKLFKKSIVKKNDLDSIVSLCDDLISNKGAAFGITVARDITDLYQTLTPENKLLFFKKINEKFKPNHSKVDEAIRKYNETQNDKNLFNLPHGLNIYFVNVPTMRKIAKNFVAISEKLTFMKMSRNRNPLIGTFKALEKLLGWI